MRPPALLLVLPAVLLGVLLGLGSFTFLYGRGYAYLLDDPDACINCHVMRDFYDAWTVASHRGVSCNECHVPHGFPTKYLAKALNGIRHSYAFTFEDVQVIRIAPANRRPLTANCQACHARMLLDIQPPGTPAARHCFDCHPGVGHGF